MGIFDQPRGSTQNPQSGGDQTSKTGDTVKSIFGRAANFLNAGLAELISPTVDTTLYFPMQPQLQSVVLTATGSIVQDRKLWSPPNGKHWMIFYANANIGTGGTLVNVDGALIPNINAPNSIPIVNFWIARNLPTLVDVIPIVGMEAAFDEELAAGQNVVQRRYSGVKSLYLNSNMAMQVILTGIVAGNPISFAIAYLELPDNLPFGRALTL